MTRVRVYVEGGGPGSYPKCRKAFKALLLKVARAKRIEVVACGARDDAIANFGIGSQQHADEAVYLLVDSEAPVRQGHTPLQHLRAQGKQLRGAQDAQVHLMAEATEAWLVADRTCLNEYYGNRFDGSALPRNPDLEAVPKADLAAGLSRAARNTPKRKYDKARDSFVLIEKLDPSVVRQACSRADRFFSAIEQDP